MTGISQHLSVNTVNLYLVLVHYTREADYYINGTKLPHLFHAVILASKLRLICHLLII